METRKILLVSKAIMDELRIDVLNEALSLFREKGLKFTMQDIAGRLHIAKKTMYKLFASKEELLLALLDDGYEKIHAEKRRIIESDLPLLEKIEKVIIAMPAQYEVLDFRQLDDLYVKYPTVAKALSDHLKNDWDPTIALLQEGIKEGVIRDINIDVLRMMITSSIQSFMASDELQHHDIAYSDALESMMDILMRGIRGEGK